MGLKGAFSPTQSRIKPTEPGLRPGALGTLQGVFGQGGPGIGDRLNQMFGLQGTGLQQQGLAEFARLLGQPTAAQQVFQAQGGAKGSFGQDILNVAQPLWQRNLNDQIAMIQGQGPRFSSGADLQSQQLRQRGLQDFDLYAQQVLEAGRARQTAAATAADTSGLNLLQGAGNFATGAQAPQLQLLQLLLPYLFQGGLSQGVITGPSVFGQIAQAAGAVASAAKTGV